MKPGLGKFGQGGDWREGCGGGEGGEDWLGAGLRQQVSLNNWQRRSQVRGHGRCGLHPTGEDWQSEKRSPRRTCIVPHADLTEIQPCSP